MEVVDNSMISEWIFIYLLGLLVIVTLKIHLYEIHYLT